MQHFNPHSKLAKLRMTVPTEEKLHFHTRIPEEKEYHEFESSG